MRKLTQFLILSLLVAFVVACNDDDDFNGPYRVNIDGPPSIAPNESASYTLGEIANAGDFNWEVSGPAEIEGSATGGSISVFFREVGTVILTVTNGVETGKYAVEVEAVDPGVEVVFGDYSALKSGEKDSIYFQFSAPINEDSVMFTLNTTDTTDFNEGKPFINATLGDVERVEGSTTLYRGLFTAGSGNGTPEIRIEKIINTEAYGGDRVDTVYVRGYRVDNIDPVARLSFDPSYISDGDSVVATLTATLSEEIRSWTKTVINEDGEEEDHQYILFNLSSDGDVYRTDTLWQGGTVTTYEASLLFYDTELNDGEIEAELLNVADIAGNELETQITVSPLILDNTNPVISASKPSVNGTVVSISNTVTDTNGATIYYSILEEGSPAISNIADFGGGVASGSGNNSINDVVTIPAGDYTIYYIAQDMAGNVSNVATSDFTVN